MTDHPIYSCSDFNRPWMQVYASQSDENTIGASRSIENIARRVPGCRESRVMICACGFARRSTSRFSRAMPAAWSCWFSDITDNLTIDRRAPNVPSTIKPHYATMCIPIMGGTRSRSIQESYSLERLTKFERKSVLRARVIKSADAYNDHSSNLPRSMYVNHAVYRAGKESSARYTAYPEKNRSLSCFPSRTRLAEQWMYI